MRTQVIAWTVVVLFSCAENKKEISPLRNLVDKKMALMNSHDVKELAKMYADTAKISSAGFETVIGPTGIMNTYSRYFMTSPDLRYEVTNTTIGETSAVVEYTSTGTMKVLEANVPEYMRDKKYTLKNCTRMEFKDGKIVDEMTYFDQAEFLKQMGFFEQQPK